MLKDIRSYKVNLNRVKKCLGLLFLGLLILSTVCVADEDQSRESSPSPIPELEVSIPKYTLLHPNWGAQFSTSLGAFGEKPLVPEQGSQQAYAFSFLTEYQPEVFQAAGAGVLGIGPFFETFLINGDVNVTPAPISLFGLGLHARYQARFFREQILVPVAGYAFEYFNYRFNTGVKGSLLSNGPTLGVWVLMNFLDRRSANSFYYNVGVQRSYLIFEYRNMRGSDSNISYSGGSYYFGLRCEF